MALISDFLREFKPSTWSTETYANKKFVRIPVDTEAVECIPIKNEFIKRYRAKYNIVAIERVQAPFLYMRYQLHRTNYEKNFSFPASESWTFVPAEEPSVDELIQYNCDERRVPRFLSLYFLSENLEMCKCVIAKKGHSYLQRDSNGYPDYIIHFEKAEPEDEIANYFSRLTLKM
ncbi:hypothetical protein PPYR_01755 [Photinus pyralis]|uniref:Uncharacterized protein n=1 Tax=Photinus pyralis TaxID=7054 RepID=A0A5N4B598_PHOPY|nr:hypothetical protein PPYR_01755 [Photinus pyralis]